MPLEIQKSQILNQQTNPLGKGATGYVFAAQYINSEEEGPRDVALKKINSERSYVRELAVFQALECSEHDNVVKLLGILTSGEDGFFTLVMPLADASLCGMLHSQILTPFEKHEFILQIALGVEYLHDLNILHRDLKPSNILVYGKIPKIADFDRAVKLVPGVDVYISAYCVGTPFYIAPEIYNDSIKRYGKWCDIFSWGIILAAIVLGLSCPYQRDGWDSPSNDDPVKSFFKKIVNKGIRPKLPSDTPPYLSYLAASTTVENVSKRPSIERVIQILRAQCIDDDSEADFVMVEPSLPSQLTACAAGMFRRPPYGDPHPLAQGVDFQSCALM